EASAPTTWLPPRCDRGSIYDMSTLNSPPAGWFWMVTDLSSTVVLKEGCAYRLTLKLKGDYRKHLSVRDNNPMYFDNLFDVRIVGIR
ncbi:hypothetical protein KKC22_02740, partial [Myxococcota bacterium]|nr:hypothetical protein [Myxococcota bacterium]